MKRFVNVACLFMVVSVMVVVTAFTAYAQDVAVKTPVTIGPVQQNNEYLSTQTTTYSDGTSLTRHIINGPPQPPPGFDVERQAVALPEPNPAMATKTLTVPAFNWVFGCSAVSGSMIAGYYDRNGFPDMYTGPTNGGVTPLDNSVWGTWSDGDDTYPNIPLAASHNGVDGRSTRGSIDDYWVQYGSSASDPYITGPWTQHTWGTAIGDYMKTSQSDYGNTDGSTSFYTWTTSAAPLTCADMVGYAIDTLDGTYGRKLFYEARGYRVTDCYSQKTDNTIGGGFSFAQFKAEIDAGRPVMLNLAGHTIVGVGYNDADDERSYNGGSTVYIHDTWDYSNHTMTWGGSYSGMLLLSVSIVNISDYADEYVTDVKRGVMIYSKKIKVSRVQGAPISITGGSYSINGGPYQKTIGKVNNGDTVTMALESSRSYCTTKKATLTIVGGGDPYKGSENATVPTIGGGGSYIFSVTTRSPNFPGKPCK